MPVQILPPPKKQKLDEKNAVTNVNTANLLEILKECLTLFPSFSAPNAFGGFDHLPNSLSATHKSRGNIRNNLKKLQNLFNDHNFRTSIVASPREALSIYKDSCILSDSDLSNDKESQNGKIFLLSMLGCHTNQAELEKLYSNSIKIVYWGVCFCHRIRQACPKSFEKDNTYASKLSSLVKTLEDSYQLFIDIDERPFFNYDTILKELAKLQSITFPSTIAQIKALILKSDPRIRPEQLEKEYERIMVQNSTFTNARVQLFLNHHKSCLKDIFLKPSHLPQYERITVYLYDPNVDLLKPPPFTFIPSLSTALFSSSSASSSVNNNEKGGPQKALAKLVMESFWNDLGRQGYFVSQYLRDQVSPELESFVLYGICQDLSTPLQLNAHFDPKHSLSLYLHGWAGAGKSSFVQHFSPALHGAIEKHLDPGLMIKFVKQNLNKPFSTLQLELELRPNNNDLSLMSIIQGRRLSLTQTKPGLVVVGMEEMAVKDDRADPNQYKVCQLISQRFAGRVGEFQEKERKAPRNAGKRGISGDASLITIFTSNYPLASPSKLALQRLEMFQSLKCIEMKAIDKQDRVAFAKSYMAQCIRDQSKCQDCHIDLDIPVGEGDTRPLVRELRMLSFFVCHIAQLNCSDKDADAVNGNACQNKSIVASVKQDNNRITTVTCRSNTIQLQLGSFDNLYPITRQLTYHDVRVQSTIQTCLKLTKKTSLPKQSELAQVIDYYFAKTLAPAVIVSKDADLIEQLVKAVALQKGVHSIHNGAMIDPTSYKMMKSLYDPSDTPNLRDDILQYGKGAYVGIGLKCDTFDAQMAIREIVEDTPSMTAFSTSKSALYKSGLFFGVCIIGDITPEVCSRASLIL